MAGGKKATTVADLLAKTTRREVTVHIFVDQKLRDRQVALEKALADALANDAIHNWDPTAPPLAEELLALEREAEEQTDEFVFQTVGARAWADMLASHPPTKEQRLEDPRVDHDRRTFPYVAIAASCVSPTMTEDEVRQVTAQWSVGMFNQLWNTCIEVNLDGGIFPKSLRAGAIARANAELGLLATNSEPLEVSSLAES